MGAVKTLPILVTGSTSRDAGIPAESRRWQSHVRRLMQTRRREKSTCVGSFFRDGKKGSIAICSRPGNFAYRIARPKILHAEMSLSRRVSENHIREHI